MKSQYVRLRLFIILFIIELLLVVIYCVADRSTVDIICCVAMVFVNGCALISSYCTHLRRKKAAAERDKRVSLFETTERFQCEYTYSEVYLGAAAKVIFTEGKFEVSMSYSERDSILVKIKRNKPYKILYDYMDGVSLVLDEEDKGYAELTEKLNNLKKGRRKQFYLDMYDRLEEEIYNYLIKCYCME